MRLPGIDVFEQVVALDVLDGIDAQRIHAHVQIAVDRADEVVLDVLALGGRDRCSRRPGACSAADAALPVAAADEALLVVPVGVQVVRRRCRRSGPGCSRARDRLAGLGIDQGLEPLRIAVVPLALPVGRQRVVDVVAVGPGVVAEIALVGAVVTLPGCRTLGDVVFDRQVVDMDLPRMPYWQE